MIDTPSLIINEVKMQRNIDKLAKISKEYRGTVEASLKNT